MSLPRGRETRYADEARFPSETVAPNEGHFRGEARSASQTHSVDDAPRRVVVESCAPGAAGEKLWARVCSRGGEQGCSAVSELRDSPEPRAALGRGWPVPPRAG